MICSTKTKSSDRKNTVDEMGFGKNCRLVWQKLCLTFATTFDKALWWPTIYSMWKHKFTVHHFSVMQIKYYISLLTSQSSKKDKIMTALLISLHNCKIPYIITNSCSVFSHLISFKLCYSDWTSWIIFLPETTHLHEHPPLVGC